MENCDVTYLLNDDTTEKFARFRKKFIYLYLS